VTSRSGPVGIGVIGAGVISDTYLKNLTSFPDIDVHAVGDLFPEAARVRAQQHSIPLAGGVSTVLDHPDIEIVVNLTIPAAHADVGHQAIAAGKHVWNEKPLALELADAQGLLDHARSADVRVGCAPDTFLGSGLQSAFALVHEGRIGEPLTALVLLQQPGPDLWHPNPAFLFQTGAGPVFDVGPYYLNALVQVLGPAVQVAATGSTSRLKRTVATGPRAGEEFDVTVPTHVSATIQFASGQSATLVLSFESPIRRTVLEVTGTEGSMVFPDPNMFDGAIAVQTASDEQPVIIAEPAALASRGTGVLDMARAIRTGQPHRAQGELAYHVLEIMTRIDQAISSSAYVPVTSTVTPAAPLPADWDPTTRTL
jgi:predicted dehydrogenase